MYKTKIYETYEDCKREKDSKQFKKRSQIPLHEDNKLHQQRWKEK